MTHDAASGAPRRAARSASRLGELGLERLEHLRDGDRAEHDHGLARLGRLRRAVVEAGQRGGDERLQVEQRGAARRGHRTARRVHLGGGEGALLEGRHPAAGGDRDPRRARAQLDRQPVARRIGQTAGQGDGIGVEHRRVPAVVARAGRRLGQPAGVGRLAVELGVRRGGRRRAGQPVGAEVGRRGRPDPPVAQHDELGGLLHEVGDAVLPDGEPPLPPHGRLAFAVEPVERPGGEVGQLRLGRRHGRRSVVGQRAAS